MKGLFMYKKTCYAILFSFLFFYNAIAMIKVNSISNLSRNDKIDVNIKDNNNRTPLDIIIRSIKGLEDRSRGGGDGYCVSGSVSTILPRVYVNQLHKAILDGKSIKDLEPLLVYDGVNSIEYYGRGLEPMNPLHVAIEKNNKEVCVWLLEKGAKIDGSGCPSPLFTAFKNKKEGLVEWLIENGATVDAVNNDGQTLLHIAAKNGNIDMAKFLLIQKLEMLNHKDSSGDTALHKACWKGYQDVCECLIEKGADVNAEGNRRLTPVCYALYGKHYELATALVNEHSASVKDPVGGETPLFIAASRGSKQEFIEFLIKNGADIKAKNGVGRTLMHIVARKKCGIDYAYLCEKGLGLNDCNNKRETPLHEAALAKNYDFAREILEWDEDLDTESDEDLDTAWDELDARRRLKRFASLLLYNGANVKEKHLKLDSKACSFLQSCINPLKKRAKTLNDSKRLEYYNGQQLIDYK